jgi:hypothetical protein
VTGRISISDARRLAGEHPELRDHLLALIDAAEALRDVHESECGCDRPGTTARCDWVGADGELLGRFEFDEEVVS